ncbi:MAG: acyl-CoA dehydrogenase family protein, partial [Myxococcales bacterium]
YGSWSVTFGAHTGIGTLPIVFFGNTAQKEKYLPKLATGELVAAYALTEPGSGSDALGAKTKAVLTADGRHYVLNGSKQFITNGAFADVFVVFAKVDGEKFTGFIVEKGTPGFSPGKEEHKMGLRGSSTTTLIFEDAKVPAENVLGEVGKGHKIAFNILNEGRLKLGVAATGGCRMTIESAVAYAKDRKQFATPILEFGLIREKLARMAAVTFANESMAWRTTGLIDQRLSGLDHDSDDFPRAVMAAMEEFALEASVLKVFGSEALSYCADEAVQIHGGYGFIEEYPVERTYRDVRVNRIFEGTNEINRMLVTGMLLKKAMKGQLPLLDFAMALEGELEAGNLPERPAHALGAEAFAAECIKRLAVYAVKVGVESFGPEIEKHQEVLAAAADIIMEGYAVDSMVSRVLQQGGTPDPVQLAMTRLYTTEAHERAYSRAKKAIA